MNSIASSQPTGWTHASFAVLVLCAGLVATLDAAILALLVWLGFAIIASVRAGHWPSGAGIALMGGYAVLLYASPWWSESYYLSWETGLIFLALPLAFLAWQFIPDADAVWSTLSRIYVPFAWIVALWGIASVLIEGRPRGLGPVADPNVYGGFINLLWFPLMADCFGRQDGLNPRIGRGSWLRFATLVLLSAALFLTYSRGAFLAWGVGLVAALWLFRSYARYGSTAILMLVAAALGYAVAAVAHPGLEVAARLGGAVSGSDASTATRLDIWGKTWQMFLAHPWLGTGLGTWVRIYPAYRSPVDNNTTGIYAHNDYLQIAQEGGLLMFAAFLLVAAYAVWLGWRTLGKVRSEPNHALEAGLMLAVGAVYLQAMVNFMFYLIYLSVGVGLYLGRVAQANGAVKKTQPPQMIARSPGQFGLLVGLALLVPVGQIGLHAVSNVLLIGDSRTLAIIQRMSPELSAYKVAGWIANFWPSEYVAQRYVVESQAQALRQQRDLSSPLKQALFEDTVSRYEFLRHAMADDPDLTAQEARMWMDEVSGAGLSKAQSLLQDALKRDPRHVESLQLLADTYFRAGNPAQGDTVLQNGMRNALFVRDRLILQAELLIYRLPEKADDLREIQQNLKNLSANCQAVGCAGKNGQVVKEAAEELGKIAADQPER
jgi:O-antigen ligase